MTTQIRDRTSGLPYRTSGLLCLKCKNSSRCGPASCGRCKQCGSMIAYMSYKYCNVCSQELESCYACGQSIQDGKVYLEDVNRGISHWRESVEQRQKDLEKHQTEFEKFKVEEKELFETDLYYTQMFNEQLTWHQKQLQDAKNRLSANVELYEKLPKMTRSELIEELNRKKTSS